MSIPTGVLSGMADVDWVVNNVKSPENSDIVVEEHIHCRDQRSCERDDATRGGSVKAIERQEASATMEKVQPACRPTFSIVVPNLYEPERLRDFHRRLYSVMERLGEPWEVVYVNDGRRDAVFSLLEELHSEDSHAAIVDLSRRFGRDIALTAGLDHAVGDAIIVIDAELQDPPEVILDLITAWRQGFDMVHAHCRVSRGETLVKRRAAAAFYRLVHHEGGGLSVPADSDDCCLMSRRATYALLRLREQQHRFMKDLPAWIGFPSKAIVYDCEPRQSNAASQNYRKLWGFAVDAVTGFTVAPLKMATYLGLFVVASAIIYGSVIAGRTLPFGNAVPAHVTLIAVVLFLSGMITLGVVGQHLGRAFNAAKRRPPYLVERYIPSTNILVPPVPGAVSTAGQPESPPSTLTVTAIVPTFNRCNYLGEAIRSLLGQTRPVDQLIIVDDGSTDDTPQVVESFSGRVTYLRKANGGKSSALNFGLKHALGELIWVFDDDDLAEPTALARFARALEDNPNCGFVYGNYDHFATFPGNTWKTNACMFRPSDPAALYPALLENCSIFHCGMVTRRSCYETVGPFDESLIRSQDYEMLLRISRHFRGVGVEGVTFHQRHHDSPRGTMALVVSDDKKKEIWKQYDQRYFGAIYSTVVLSEYLPHAPGGPVRPDDELTPRERMTALIQRCCVMAKRSLWDLAAQDLEEVSTLADALHIQSLTPFQIDMFQKVLDAYWNGKIDIDKQKHFHRAIRGFTSNRLRRQIRSALMFGLVYHTRKALRERDRVALSQSLAAYRTLATPSAVVEHVVSRISKLRRAQLNRSKARAS
jgi:polyisoprenyl-phosphate glycosyltransferase